jgi:hypothetical protein
MERCLEIVGMHPNGKWRYDEHTAETMRMRKRKT